MGRVASSVGYRANPIISDVMRRVRGRGRPSNLTFHATDSAWRENTTYLEFRAGAARRAQELGFSLELLWARESHLGPRRLTEILRSRGISGVIVGPRPDKAGGDLFDYARFSVAVIGVPLHDVPLHRAGSFFSCNMDRALAVLAQRGYRRSGLALFGAQWTSTDPGWRAVWAFHQQQAPAAQRVPVLGLESLGEKGFLRWFERHRPDVVIGLQDECVAWLEGAGVRVPDDVGFVRLSRSLAGRHPAGIHQHPEAIGAAAVDLVANQIFARERGVPAAPRPLLIEGKWVGGWSVK